MRKLLPQQLPMTFVWNIHHKCDVVGCFNKQEVPKNYCKIHLCSSGYGRGGCSNGGPHIDSSQRGKKWCNKCKQKKRHYSETARKKEKKRRKDMLKVKSIEKTSTVKRFNTTSENLLYRIRNSLGACMIKNIFKYAYPWKPMATRQKFVAKTIAQGVRGCCDDCGFAVLANAIKLPEDNATLLQMTMKEVVIFETFVSIHCVRFCILT